MASKWTAEEESDSEEEVQPTSTASAQNSAKPKTTNVAAPAKRSAGPPVGLMMKVNYSASKVDVEAFLHDHDVNFKNLEPLMNDGSFAGKVKVYFDDETSFHRFLDLNGSRFMDFDIVTKEWEDRGPRKPSGGRGFDRQIGRAHV